MAETEMQKSQAAQQAAASELQSKQTEQKKDISQLLSAFGGFNAIRGFLPDENVKA